MTFFPLQARGAALSASVLEVEERLLEVCAGCAHLRAVREREAEVVLSQPLQELCALGLVREP